jgi:hypothetical protein
MATYASIKYDMALSSSHTGGGSMVLLETQTASGDGTISFTSGIDSTFDNYVFKYINVHPADNAIAFHFNGTIDGSNWNVTKTTNHFRAYHLEDDTAAAMDYLGAHDIAQGTGFQALSNDVGNDADQQCSGTLSLFGPSSTTFVKHFIAETQTAHGANYPQPSYVAGYFNTTSAITGIRFKFNSGDIDAGTFKMYGVL